MHRGVGIIPKLLGRVGVALFFDLHRPRPATAAGIDECVVVDDRRRRVVAAHPLRPERRLPHLLPVGRAERDDLALGHRDDELLGAGAHDYRRRVAGTVARPLPFLFAAAQVIGDHRAVVLPTDLRNRHAVHDDRRAGDMEPGRRALEVVLAPQELALVGVDTGHRPLDAERHHLALRDRRRAARAGELAVGSADRLGRVLLLPYFVAGLGVEAADHFVIVLSREDVEPVAHQRRRRHAVADARLPRGFQFLGPLLRRLEVGGLGVAVGPAPLGPVRRRDARPQRHAPHHRRRRLPDRSHSCSWKEVTSLERRTRPFLPGER